jgi:hypothetical protein
VDGNRSNEDKCGITDVSRLAARSKPCDGTLLLLEKNPMLNLSKTLLQPGERRASIVGGDCGLGGCKPRLQVGRRRLHTQRQHDGRNRNLAERVSRIQRRAKIGQFLREHLEETPLEQRVNVTATQERRVVRENLTLACCERLACIRAPEVPAIPASLPPGEAAVAGLVGASAADVEKRAQSTNSHVACGRELGVDREQLEVESARAQVRSVVAIVERKPGTIGVRGEALAESHSQASRLE